MTCNDYEVDFGAVLSGDFTRDEFKRANAHLAACEECRKMYAELGAFRKAVRESYNFGAETKRRPWRAVAAMALAASLVAGVILFNGEKNVEVMQVASIPGDQAQLEVPVQESPQEEILLAGIYSEDEMLDLLSDEELMEISDAAQ